MKCNSVGITRIVPKAEFVEKPYRDLAEVGCKEIRERFFENGNRILMGYKDGQKTAFISQKLSYNQFRFAMEERLHSIDIYGKNKEYKEVSIEKSWYNRIGDRLKFSHLIKNYEKNKLVKTQSITNDIISGVDTATTTYTKDSKEFNEKKIHKIQKQRFSPNEFLLVTTDSKGNITRENCFVNDNDGFWIYE